MKQINIVNTIDDAKNLVAKQLIYDNTQKKIIWTIQPNQGENFSLCEDNDGNIGPDIFVVSITYHDIDSSKEYEIYSDFRSMKIVKIVYNDREIERYVYVDETNYYDILYRFKFDNDGDNTVYFYFSKDFTDEEYILLNSGTIKSSLSTTVYLNKYISNIPTLGLVDKIICDAPVIKINKSKFFNPYKLESFEYSGVIEYIPDNAFDCSPGGESVKFKYMSLDFKEGLTYIGNNAFQYALIVGNLNIPSTCKYVGNNAFNSCKNITSVTINDGVEYIGQHAFYGLTVTSITIPGTVKTLERVIDYCQNLESIILKDGVENIENDLASQCPNLKYVEIPGTVKKLNKYILQTNKNIETVILGDGIEYIDDEVFRQCSLLTEITLPDSIKSIGSNAFFMCTGLTELTLPNSLTSIGSSAFVNCMMLKNVTLSNADIIDSSVFNGCANIENITINNTKILNNIFDTCKKIKSVTLNNTEIIGDSVFINCKSLIELTLSNNLKSIGINTFQGCSGLTELTLPDSLTSIGKYAFAGCASLTELTLPNSLTLIGQYAFAGCTNVIIHVPETVETIEDGAFADVKKVVLKNYTRFDNWQTWGATEIVEE